MNLKKLIYFMNERGVDDIEMIRKLGISETVYKSRLKGETEFNLQEILTISKILKLSSQELEIIFFGKKVS